MIRHTDPGLGLPEGGAARTISRSGGFKCACVRSDSLLRADAARAEQAGTSWPVTEGRRAGAYLRSGSDSQSLCHPGWSATGLVYGNELCPLLSLFVVTGGDS